MNEKPAKTKILDIHLIASSNARRDIVVSGTILSRTAKLTISHDVIDIIAEATEKAKEMIMLENEQLSICYCCGNPFPNDDMYETHYEHLICENCYNNYYERCNRCKEIFYDHDVRLINGEDADNEHFEPIYHCESCREEIKAEENPGWYYGCSDEQVYHTFGKLRGDEG